MPSMENTSEKQTRPKRRLFRIIGIGLLLIFVVMQFIQPGKNNQHFDMTNDIATVVSVPDSVHQLLKTACYDCHSNQTNYPWYANIQPLGWWLKDHIEEGKSHLNFQDFALVEPRPGTPYNTKALRQDHKLEEVNEQVENGEMPLESYTLIHRESRLTQEQRILLIDWTNDARKELMTKNQQEPSKEE